MDTGNYRALRDQIATGCVVLWRGKGIVPWLIQRFTRFNHASMIVRLETFGELMDRVFLVEALTHGPSLRFLSYRIDNYDGEVYLFKPLELTEKKQACIAKNSVYDVAEAKKYDLKGMLANIFGRVNINLRRYFCSEEVDVNLRKCGLMRKKEFQGPKAPRPGDIPNWYDGELIRIK